jgi:hypothetical protein
VPYKFNFDLTSIPKNFFKELLIVAYKANTYGKIGLKAKNLVRKFRLNEIIGIDLYEAISLVEDLLTVYVKNIQYKPLFESTNKRALILPHCARKYMDSRCKAVFDPNVPTYICQACSEDCLVNQSSKIARERGYDVYVVPGGSCLPKILKERGYEGVVGVACSQELKLAISVLEKFGIPGQGVPLIRNGCSNTKFELEALNSIL